MDIDYKIKQLKLGQEVFFTRTFGGISRGIVISINCDKKIKSDLSVLVKDDCCGDYRKYITIDCLVDVPRTRRELYTEIRRILSDKEMSKQSLIDKIREWRDLGIIDINLP